MQNWDSLQPANYELNWYSNTFGTRNDSHPTSTTAMNPITTTIEQCFNNLKQQTQTGMDITSSPISSPRNSDCQDMNYLDNSNETTTTIASNTNHQHHHQNHHNHHQSHNHNHPLGFNPLTPPGLPNAVLPSMNFRSSDLNHDPSEKHENQLKIDDNSLTPRNTPPVDVTPPKSPKNFNNHDTTLDNDMMSNSSEDTRFLESEDDDQIRVPIYNSHGKMKNYKCKHCGFTAITKITFWNHAREHMKPEKMLQCPKCPFVTELKHHLEYHIRKHKNLKPFQCDKCNYSCVNKSMLNSHLKSHSSVYQYRCSDCDYATKYCHSFKLHLRKYEHKPGMVLDEDGTPNPSVVIDVYGTRRGPKMKSGKSRSKTSSRKTAQSTANKSLNSVTNDKTKEPKNSDSGQMTPKLPANEKNIRNSTSNILPNNLANMLHQTRNMSFLPYFNLNLQMIAAQQHAAWTQISPQIQQNMFRPSNEDSLSEMQKIKNPKEPSDEEDSVEQKCNVANDAMDLSHNTLVKANVLIHSETQTYQEKVKEEHNVPTITSSSCNRSGGGGSGKRKCRKIDHHQMEKNSINGKLQQQLHDTVKIDFPDNNNTTKNSYPIYESKTELPSSSQDDIKVTNSNSNENSDKNSSPTLSTSSTATSSSALSASTSTSTAADCSTSPQTPQNPVQNNNFQIPGIFECKYCDIYFKDAVLYTIHMGYHSCDDVFKCNMCGEKCDGPVGLFIHMARNPHS